MSSMLVIHTGIREGVRNFIHRERNCRACLFAGETLELAEQDKGCRKRTCGVLVKIVEFYPDKLDLIHLL